MKRISLLLVTGRVICSDVTLRLMSGKPWPGAGGLVGRGPRGGLVLEVAGEGEAFLLNGFSLQVRYTDEGEKRHKYNNTVYSNVQNVY